MRAKTTITVICLLTLASMSLPMNAEQNEQAKKSVQQIQNEILNRDGSVRAYCDRIRLEFMALNDAIDWAKANRLKDAISDSDTMSSDKKRDLRIAEMTQQRNSAEQRFGLLGCIQFEVQQK